VALEKEHFVKMTDTEAERKSRNIHFNMSYEPTFGIRSSIHFHQRFLRYEPPVQPVSLTGSSAIAPTSLQREERSVSRVAEGITEYIGPVATQRAVFERMQKDAKKDMEKQKSRLEEKKQKHEKSLEIKKKETQEAEQAKLESDKAREELDKARVELEEIQKKLDSLNKLSESAVLCERLSNLSAPLHPAIQSVSMDELLRKSYSACSSQQAGDSSAFNGMLDDGFRELRNAATELRDPATQQGENELASMGTQQLRLVLLRNTKRALHSFLDTLQHHHRLVAQIHFLLSKEETRRSLLPSENSVTGLRTIMLASEYQVGRKKLSFQQHFGKLTGKSLLPKLSEQYESADLATNDAAYHEFLQRSEIVSYAAAVESLMKGQQSDFSVQRGWKKEMFAKRNFAVRGIFEATSKFLKTLQGATENDLSLAESTTTTEADGKTGKEKKIEVGEFFRAQAAKHFSGAVAGLSEEVEINEADIFSRAAQLSEPHNASDYLSTFPTHLQRAINANLSLDIHSDRHRLFKQILRYMVVRYDLQEAYTEMNKLVQEQQSAENAMSGATGEKPIGGLFTGRGLISLFLVISAILSLVSVIFLPVASMLAIMAPTVFVVNASQALLSSGGQETVRLSNSSLMHQIPVFASETNTTAGFYSHLAQNGASYEDISDRVNEYYLSMAPMNISAVSAINHPAAFTSLSLMRSRYETVRDLRGSPKDKEGLKNQVKKQLMYSLMNAGEREQLLNADIEPLSTAGLPYIGQNSVADAIVKEIDQFFRDHFAGVNPPKTDVELKDALDAVVRTYGYAPTNITLVQKIQATEAATIYYSNRLLQRETTNLIRQKTGAIMQNEIGKERFELLRRIAFLRVVDNMTGGRLDAANEIFEELIANGFVSAQGQFPIQRVKEEFKNDALRSVQGMEKQISVITESMNTILLPRAHFNDLTNFTTALRDEPRATLARLESWVDQSGYQEDLLRSETITSIANVAGELNSTWLSLLERNAAVMMPSCILLMGASAYGMARMGRAILSQGPTTGLEHMASVVFDQMLRWSPVVTAGSAVLSYPLALGFAVYLAKIPHVFVATLQSTILSQSTVDLGTLLTFSRSMSGWFFALPALAGASLAAAHWGPRQMLVATTFLGLMYSVGAAGVNLVTAFALGSNFSSSNLLWASNILTFLKQNALLEVGFSTALLSTTLTSIALTVGPRRIIRYIKNTYGAGMTAAEVILAPFGDRWSRTITGMTTSTALTYMVTRYFNEKIFEKMETFSESLYRLLSDPGNVVSVISGSFDESYRLTTYVFRNMLYNNSETLRWMLDNKTLSVSVFSALWITCAMFVNSIQERERERILTNERDEQLNENIRKNLRLRRQ
jgi:Skp family chaperone for outer membrane proteins